MHTARFLSLATEILSSVVSDEKEFLAYLILKIVVSDKNLLICFPHIASFRRQRKNLRPQRRNRAVRARLYNEDYYFDAFIH